MHASLEILPACPKVRMQVQFLLALAVHVPNSQPQAQAQAVHRLRVLGVAAAPEAFLVLPRYLPGY